LPLPDAPEKSFATEVVTRLLLRLAKGALDDGLGRDAGVVGARKPEDFVAQHARATGEDVLNRVVEHMAEREDAGDVRRRNDDGKRRLRGRRVRVKTTVRDPAGIPLLLDGCRLITLRDVDHGNGCS